ncbi:MAG: CBS domain-containing protein [Gemmataceae bacterium]|nr:CBS domain-containing protein [Gemmataceae bacterium]MDW8265586.1 CBS domain-containing protein [Gemmataceae bacterium]
MICPNCGYDNLPGSEECSSCQQDLTQLDRPTANNRVEQSLMEDRVGLLEPRKPITVKADATIREAIQTMMSHSVGSLLVVDDDGRLIGVFTERDILTKIAGRPEGWMDLPVGPFMTPKPECVTSNDTLAFALHKMDIGGYRHLPVVREGKPEGVISVRDMLRHITQLCREI